MTGVGPAALLAAGVQAGQYQDLLRRACAAFPDGAAQQWEAERHIPRAALSALAAGGVFRARWEPGAIAGLPHAVAMSQELSRYSSGLAVAAMGHSEIFIGALTRHARTQAQHALLRDALDGQAIGCFAATEPQGGSSLADLVTSAERADGGWRLRGTKRFVSNAGGATHAAVLARAGTAGVPAGTCAAPTAGPQDLSLFVVPLNLPGVRVDGFFDMSGARACDVGQVTFDAVVSPDALLGRQGLGLLYASHLLQFERLAICAQLLAAAQGALGLATAYARRRVVGGSRVMDKQVIRHRLALGYAELWNLQSRLASLVEMAVRTDGMPAHQIAALKLTTAQAVTRLVDMCQQVFGARGDTTAYPLEKLARDCRIARIGGGTDEVLADVVASLIDRPDAAAEDLLDRAAAADLPQPRSPGRPPTSST
jgi:alkylation response protein AidB-like acyl-CoA dehydrogenase